MAARTWSQSVARGEVDARSYLDLALELRGTIDGLLDVVGLLLALRRREGFALVALARVAEALADFDDRCAQGDIAGAVLQLRLFIQRYRDGE
jgi:hypothetical protein